MIGWTCCGYHVGLNDLHRPRVRISVEGGGGGGCHWSDVLQIGYMHTGVVVKYDSRIKYVTGIKNVLDFPHQFHTLPTPLQRQKWRHIATSA